MKRATVIIPTYNGGKRIAACLQALCADAAGADVEVLVVDDGSTDDTVAVAGSFPQVRVLSQPNAGPAAARNHGALQATGGILLFTDDDCVPLRGWLAAMLAPFEDPRVVGAKGVYQTQQRQFTARFVQIEYEDKYRIMAAVPAIDFVDTYSAAFRRERFLEMGGYDRSFPVACAEDIELSYRMSARGWHMTFVPDAVVCHSHPDSLAKYLRKKYKFAYWRVYAVKKNPSKLAKDSHTPQLMKLQLALLPALLVAVIAGGVSGRLLPAVGSVVLAFLFTTLPFVFRALPKDPLVGCLSPLFLAGRAMAQCLGVTNGLLFLLRQDDSGAYAPTLPQGSQHQSARSPLPSSTEVALPSEQS